MPASLTMDAYLEAISAAAARLRDDTAGPTSEQPVPTCPEWSARQLIAHTGMVHRWAAGIVTGTLHRGTVDAATEAFQQEGVQHRDPGAWLMAGAEDLTRALHEAPEDLDVFFFLNEAPRSRLAWARRQCHETTIHAFDGLAARLGRVPSAADADLDLAIAADGIDELLAGFATRDGEALRLPSPVTVVVDATDARRSWTLRLSEGPVVCEEGPTVESPDATWSGTAAQLYLGLWNRGSEIRQAGDDVLTFWHDHLHIEWN